LTQYNQYNHLIVVTHNKLYYIILVPTLLFGDCSYHHYAASSFLDVLDTFLLIVDVVEFDMEPRDL